MSNEQVAPETKGVAVELLATVDVGPKIEGMAGLTCPGIFGPFITGERLPVGLNRSVL